MYFTLCCYNVGLYIPTRACWRRRRRRWGDEVRVRVVGMERKGVWWKREDGRKRRP